MDEGRLKAVKKGQKLHRKFAYAMNDTIRNRQEYYQSCLSREEQEAHARLVSKVMDMRKTVVRNSLLLQCLNLHRKNQPDRARTEPLLGSYGGRPIDSFSRDIDQRLAWFHPRLRRLRKVDRIKQSCLRHGAILDEDTIKDRMQDFFAKNLESDPSDMGKPGEPEDNNPHDRKTKNGGADDEDDDDFDIRNYHNPIAGKIQLRLHPFGNMVEFNSGGDSKKFNVRKTGKIFNRNTRDIKDEGLGNASEVDLKLPKPMADSVQFSSRVNSEPASHQIKEENVLTPAPERENPPPRFSKYPEPLPPIVSGDRQKAPKSKGQSSKASKELPGRGESQEKDKQNQASVSGAGATFPAALRLSHAARQGAGVPDERSVADAGSRTGDQPEEAAVPKLTRRKTLILPPLETTKDMIKK